MNFAPVGKRRDPTEPGSTPRPLDDLERKLACTQGGHHEPAPLIGRVGLVVAPAAKRNQQIQVEVGTALGALNHVVDVQAAPHAAGLTAPAGTREHLLPNGRPLGPARRPASSRSRAARAHRQSFLGDVRKPKRGPSGSPRPSLRILARTFALAASPDCVEVELTVA